MTLKSGALTIIAVACIVFMTKRSGEVLCR